MPKKAFQPLKMRWL